MLGGLGRGAAQTCSAELLRSFFFVFLGSCLESHRMFAADRGDWQSSWTLAVPGLLTIYFHAGASGPELLRSCWPLQCFGVLPFDEEAASLTTWTCWHLKTPRPTFALQAIKFCIFAIAYLQCSAQTPLYTQNDILIGPCFTVMTIHLTQIEWRRHPRSSSSLSPH